MRFVLAFESKKLPGNASSTLVIDMAEARGTQLTWFGHSAFRVETPGGHVLLIDPWIQNPTNPNARKDLADLKKVDLIFVTHGHSDHVGDAVEIAKRTRAKLVATFDLATAMIKLLGYPQELADGETVGHFGGEVSLLDGEIVVTFVRAHHGGTLSAGEDGRLAWGGSPGGFVIAIRGGPTIYHTGDTDLFSDMSWIPQFHKIDFMLVCMGDQYTMGPARAAEAVKLVNPAVVIPMHYGTFPLLRGTPEKFHNELRDRGAHATLKVLQVGEPFALAPL